MNLQRPSLRRVLFAILVTVSVFLVGELTLGFAVAQGSATEAALGPLPAQFGVAAPRIGDLIQYSTREERHGPDGQYAERDLGTFHPLVWEDQTQLLDGDGVPRRAHLLRTLYDSSGVHDESTWYDAHEHERIGLRRVHGHEEQRNETHLILPSQTDSQSDSRADHFARPGEQGWHEAICGLYNPLQGAPTNTSHGIQLFERCRIDDYDLFASAGPHPTFHATGSQQLGEHETVVYHLPNAPPPYWHNPLNDDVYNITVWFTEDIPYPLRFEISDDSGNGFVDITILELAGYHRGTGPLLSDEPTTIPAAPPILLAPTPLWGINDEGIDHAFPLSEAFAGARDDPMYADVRVFLAEHPDAFAQSAAYDEYRRDFEILHRWTIALTDGQDFIEFCYTKAVSTSPADDPSGGIASLGDAVATYRGEPCHWRGQVVPADRRPAVVPTASSMLSRVQAHIDSEERPEVANDYGFVVCPVECEGFEPYEAGSTFSEHLNEGNGLLFHLGDNQTSRESVIGLEADGFVRAYRVTRDFHSRDTQTPSEPPTNLPASGPKLQSFEAGAVVTWLQPPTAVAIGIGTVASATGLLYAFWPSVKGLVSGLFTRVTQPKVLDHPNRRRIEALLAADPGLHVHEISRRLELPRGTVEHHLQQLVRVGVISSRVGAGYTCYFVRGQVDRRAMNAAPVLKAEGARKVLDAITRTPGAPLSELAAMTGLKGATVHYHVNRLRVAGIVKTQRDGVRVRHYVVE